MVFSCLLSEALEKEMKREYASREFFREGLEGDLFVSVFFFLNYYSNFMI